MNQKKLIFLAALISLLIGLVALKKDVLLHFFSRIKTATSIDNQSLSIFSSRPSQASDILYLTSPVKSFSGKIEKIEDNKIWIKKRLTLNNNPSKDIVFKFLVTPQTKIFRPKTYVPYLFKSTTSFVDDILTLKDLKIGQYVGADTNMDLRIVSKNTPDTTTIQVLTTSNVLHGSIEKISANTLVMKATPPNPPFANEEFQQPKEKIYTITITSDTEISRKKYNNGAPEQIPFSQLTSNMEATVYTTEDVVLGTQLTALLIEPIDTALEPTPTNNSK